MALTAALASEYERASLQQLQLYSFWIDAGDPARAHLALDVGNWFNQQLSLPIYLPANDPAYTPNPTSPTAAIALAASLPLPLGGGSTTAGNGAGAASSTSGVTSADFTREFPDAITTGSPGSGSDSSQNDFTPIQGVSPGTFQDLSVYCMVFPDDPICYNFGYNFYSPPADGGPVTIINTNTTVVINETGVTAGDVASAIQGALGKAANAIAAAVDAGLAAAISGIQSALNALGNELVSVFHLLSRLAGLILKFLQGLLLDVIHGLVAAVNAIGKMLKDVIQNVLLPLLHGLQELRDYLVKIYQRFLRPLLIWIQDVRKVLAILRVFHIGFATKLDNVLNDIQAKISAPLLYLMGWTNTIANYINLILDANLLLQKPLWLASYKQYIGSSLNLQLNAMTGTPDPAAIAALQTTPAPASVAQSSADLNHFLADGKGPIADAVTPELNQLSVYLAQGVQ